MADGVLGLNPIIKPRIHSLQTTSLDVNISCPKSLRQCSSCTLFGAGQQIEGISRKGKRGCLSKVNAFPDWPVMAMLVDNLKGQMDYIVDKSIWHLSDQEIKNVYIGYIMFTCWGCLVFGSMKDPYYDSDAYRKDGGDGTGNWIYETQDDMEETARSELWKEELIEEIEQKVGSLRELEKAGKN